MMRAFADGGSGCVGQVIEAKGKAGGIRRARWSWKTGRFVCEADVLDFCI